MLPTPVFAVTINWLPRRLSPKIFCKFLHTKKKKTIWFLQNILLICEKSILHRCGFGFHSKIRIYRSSFQVREAFFLFFCWFVILFLWFFSCNISLQLIVLICNAYIEHFTVFFAWVEVVRNDLDFWIEFWFACMELCLWMISKWIGYVWFGWGSWL